MGTVCEESSTMMQYTLPEIWKQYAVLQLFMSEALVWRYLPLWVSIWGQCCRFEKNWIGPVVIRKIWLLGSPTLIVWIRTSKFLGDIFHWHRQAWLTIWDKVKSHGTVRLMHWKRVTCILHDSYFHSMTIKHAIPRTAEVTHHDGQLWGDTEWAIELLYNSVKTGSQLVGVEMS